MNNQPQPQLTAGDELEMELRSRLVDLERGNQLLAAGMAAIAAAVLFLLIRWKANR